MQGIFIPLARNCGTSLMNLDSSFSTAATTGPATTATNWQVRAEHLFEELQEVRDNMNKAQCQFDQQIIKLESAIRDIERRKRQFLSPLEYKEQDIVDELRRIQGLRGDRVDRRQLPSSFSRPESSTSSSQQSQQSQSSIEHEHTQPWIINRHEITHSEHGHKKDSIKQIDRRIRILQRQLQQQSFKHH